MRRLLPLLGLSASLVLSSTAWAHDGHAEAPRLWRGAHGEQWQGDFVDLRADGRVILNSAAGGLTILPLAAFSEADRAALSALAARILGLQQAAAVAEDKPVPAQAVPFRNIAAKLPEGQLAVRWDARFLWVESDGLPTSHELMAGITAWQQQVPLPQHYKGANAWRIPLKPVPAAEPIPLKTHFFRGAVALAANGVPIFNPIKNDGKTDTFTAGELDRFGGHCGRGDDYHYHIAPLHLQAAVGAGLPVAYALDGYPIYGLTEPDGAAIQVELDACHGHTGPGGDYHYHASAKYPYILSAFHGQVVEKDGQVDPQPRAFSPRRALPPLRGAVVTACKTAPGACTLTYAIGTRTGSVAYQITGDQVAFTFAAPGEAPTHAAYSLKDDRKGPPGGGAGGSKGFNPQDHARPAGEGGRPPRERPDSPPAPREDAPPAPKEDAAAAKAAAQPAPQAAPKVGGFTLTSPAFAENGAMPVEFTGDGDGISPPLAWTGAPAGTRWFALQLWHVPHPGEEPHSYWVLYDIPATVTQLEKGSKGVGTAGLNDKHRTDYDPMKSKGPGVKAYHITLHALSAKPQLKERATRAELLAAIKDITLAETTLDYTYDRSGRKN